MRYLWILVALTTASHADDTAPVKARKAAQQAERDAAASKDIAKYVACGNAYLELYTKYPDGDGDEVLYNAATCFRDGKSIGAAFQAYDLLMRMFPTSKLAPRALASSGVLYAQIGQLDRAAERLEKYARTYAGEKDAIDALSDATLYRRALGDRARTIENTKYFVKTFGAKRRKQAAEADINLTWAYDSDPAAQLKHLAVVLRQHPLADEQRAWAHKKMGDLLSAQSCPVPLQDGLCVKAERERSAATPRCSKSAVRFRPVTRSKVHEQAVAAYTAAAKLFDRIAEDAPAGRHAAAMAKLALVDSELESLLALQLPAGLDLSSDPKREAARKQSLKKLSDWLATAMQREKQAREHYEAVLALKEPHSSIVALARIGQTSLALSRAIRDGEIPKPMRTGPKAKDTSAAYCNALDEHTAPLDQRASEAFQLCVTKATELGVDDAYSRMCQREGQLVDAARFPPRPMIPAPAALTIPMVSDTIGEPDWRAGRRDAAIKAWEDALAKNGKLLAPRINLALARYEQLRALAKTDATRKQLAETITQHAQAALALDADPTPRTLLAALALDDSKRPEMASYLLQDAVRSHEKYAPAYLGLGILAVQRDQWSAALAQFERAAALDPKSEPTALAHALALLRVGRHAAAATKLGTIKASTYEAEVARGAAAHGLGKHADAKAAYQRAVKLDANRPEATHNLTLLDAKRAAP